MKQSSMERTRSSLLKPNRKHRESVMRAYGYQGKIIQIYKSSYPKPPVPTKANLILGVTCLHSGSCCWSHRPTLLCHGRELHRCEHQEVMTIGSPVSSQPLLPAPWPPTLHTPLMTSQVPENLILCSVCWKPRILSFTSVQLLRWLFGYSFLSRVSFDLKA